MADRRSPALLLFAAGAAAALGAGACVTETPFPGDESMGVFSFTASPPASQTLDGGEVVFPDVQPGDPACPFEEIGQGGFEFEGQFSRWQDGREVTESGVPLAWFTLRGISREGSWDGQVFQSTYSAPRRFETEVCPPEYVVEETMTVVLLSESQSRALGDGCPAEVRPLLDGGVPLDPDAGITSPQTRQDGFDAIRACGILTDVIRSAQVCPDAGDPPGPAARCVVRYRLDGVRKQ